MYSVVQVPSYKVPTTLDGITYFCNFETDGRMVAVAAKNGPPFFVIPKRERQKA